MGIQSERVVIGRQRWSWGKGGARNRDGETESEETDTQEREKERVTRVAIGFSHRPKNYTNCPGYIQGSWSHLRPT